MYHVNDKSFTQLCDATEYSWQLCYHFSKETPTWKIVRMKNASGIKSYGVYDIEGKEMVYEAIVVS